MNEYLTVQEAADRSGYSAEHIRRMIRAGVLPALKFGILWAIRPEDLDTYLQEQEARAVTDQRRKPRKG